MAVVTRRILLKTLGCFVAAASVGSILSYWHLHQPTTEKTGSTTTVVDTAGREVTLPYPVKSCVVGDDSIAELIQVLGAEDTIIGVEDSIPKRGYFPKLEDKPPIGNQWRGLNYELIAELNPDVVIVYGNLKHVEQILGKLEEIGIKTLCVDPSVVDGPRTKSIEILGKIFGREEFAEKFMAWRGKLLTQLGERLAGLKEEEKVNAYLAMGMGKLSGDKLPTKAYGGKHAHIITIEEWAKIENIVSKVLPESHSGKVDLEWIAEENPDMLIIGVWSSGREWDLTGYYVTDPSAPAKYINSLMANEVLKQTKAVKNGRVFLIDHLLTGTRPEVGAFYLAKAAYPSRMEGIDPEEIHREYFESWLRVKYQGIWFYPQRWKGDA